MLVLKFKDEAGRSRCTISPFVMRLHSLSDRDRAIELGAVCQMRLLPLGWGGYSRPCLFCFLKVKLSKSHFGCSF